MNIFQINSEIERALWEAIDPSTGEILDDDALQAYKNLLLAKDEKIENTLLLYKNVLAEAEAIKAESEKLKERARITANKAESIKKLCLLSIGEEGFSTPRVKASFRKSTAVEIIDETIIPLDYVKTEMVSKVDKKALGAALKEGKAVPGACLSHRKNLQIQ